MKQMVWKLLNALPEVLAITKINTLSNGNTGSALFPLERFSNGQSNSPTSTSAVSLQE